MVFQGVMAIKNSVKKDKGYLLMNLKDKLTFNLTDLTGIGIPQSSIGSKFFSNEQLYEIDPVRFQFYIQILEALSSSNPKILEDIFTKTNLTRYQREELNNNLDSIRLYFEKNKDKLDDTLLEEIQGRLKTNILTDNVKITQTTRGGGEYQPSEKEKEALKSFVDAITPPEIEYNLTEPKSYVQRNPYTDSQDLTADVKKIIVNNPRIIDQYKNSYEYGPEAEKVNMSDRVIFIIATYIIRSIALFMVEWGVHTNFINSFVKAFSLYFGVYACVFLLLYILTNAREDDYLFRMLFFYINTQSEDGKGVLRVIIHLVCVLFLFPIPFVVREYRELEASQLSFTQKRTVIGAVEKFTMIVWILTSVIALRI